MDEDPDIGFIDDLVDDIIQKGLHERHVEGQEAERQTAQRFEQHMQHLRDLLEELERVLVGFINRQKPDGA